MTTIDDLLEVDSADLEAALMELPPEAAEALLYDWHLWARDDQRPPEGDWMHWLILAGRGWGKTRTGAETVREWVDSGNARLIALVAETPADARDVMIEGESGLLEVYPDNDPNRPHYEPSKRRVSWPNGARATIYSSQEPDQLRGPSHDTYWCDEPAKFEYPTETWDNLMFGFRLGWTRGVITGTPRPIDLIKELLNDPDTAVTRGATYDNIENLAPAFSRYILRKYEGTTLGRQELHAQILDDVEGALWTLEMLQGARWTEKRWPSFDRIVVAVDPAVTSNEDSDETGITVQGKVNDLEGYRPGPHGFVLEDRSGRYTPGEWANEVAEAYHEWGADLVVGEVNNGGDLVESNLRGVDPTIHYKDVRATRGKKKRAEPVSGLYEQGRVHHIGSFSEMEDQMRTYDPDDKNGASPDRMDAVVWGFTELLLGEYRKRPTAKASVVR